YTPGEHNWRQLLATPRENVPPTAADSSKHAKWEHEYKARVADAAKKHEPTPVEFPPDSPYHDWANQIAIDWRAVAQKVKGISGLTDVQKDQVDKVLHTKLHEMSDYLASQAEDIAAYRHDLWRLQNWRDAPEAASLPFYQERIATKASDANGQLQTWLTQVQTLDADYVAGLDHVFTPEQRNEAAIATAFREAVTDPHQARLNTLNVGVTILIIGVGACLLLGLFTRLAAIAGAVFLLGVIASQPFWLSDALPTMPQYIELAALLVLAATGAGRWFGLDYFTYSFFNRFRRPRT
ncbi:MAG TPA: DoxX family protein, partial [Lacipirellulaceae bacterium]|nr:DoxX family protein [Lacipirellulaceae bacterium]